MDGVEASTSHVFVLSGTNAPNEIDSAVLSRFTERLSIPLPNRDNRMRLLDIMLKADKAEVTVTDLALLATTLMACLAAI